MLQLLRSSIASTSRALLPRSAPSCCCGSQAQASTSWQGRLMAQIPSARLFSASTTDLQKVKIKTHKGTAKRWASLPSGQYKRGRPGKRHLNASLSSERLNRLGKTGYATPAQVKVLKRLLPGQ